MPQSSRPAVHLPEDARILVTRTDRMGDLILSTPVFSALRAAFPKAWIAAVVFQENRELVEGNPALNEVILYDKKKGEKGLWGNFLFSRRLAREKFDAVIHLHPTNRMHWTAFLARIPIRIGWDRKAPRTLTHAYPHIKNLGGEHEAEYNFHLLKDLGVSAPSPLRPYFPVRDQAVRSLDEFLFQLGVPKDRPWIALNPSASCPSKIWPAARFARLAERLGEKYHAEIFIIGGGQDRRYARRVSALSRYPVRDLCGRLSLGMLGSFLRKTALLVSNDTGPAHVASAVGTPVVVLFGRRQPGLSWRRWKPLGEQVRVLWKDVGCEPCLAHDCQINFLCLDAISVDEVLSEARPFLQEAVPAGGGKA